MFRSVTDVPGRKCYPCIGTFNGSRWSRSAATTTTGWSAPMDPTPKGVAAGLAYLRRAILMRADSGDVASLNRRLLCCNAFGIKTPTFLQKNHSLKMWVTGNSARGATFLRPRVSDERFTEDPPFQPALNPRRASEPRSCSQTIPRRSQVIHNRNARLFTAFPRFCPSYSQGRGTKKAGS